MTGRSSILHVLALLLCLSFFVIQASRLVFLYSDTFDEHAHTGAGYCYLKTGHFAGGWNNPPFLQTLLGLPYGLGAAPYDPWTTRPLLWARAVNVLLAVSLFLFTYLLARELLGRDAALLAVFLCCTSPVVIGNAALATLDLGVCLFCTATVYFLLLAERRGRLAWTMLAGVCMGLAIASKFTVMPILGLIPVLLLWPSGRKRRKWLPFIRDMILLYGISFFCFCATYSFDGCLSSKKVPFNMPLVDAVAYLAPVKAVDGFQAKLYEGHRGAPVYLFGWCSEKGFAFYYPLVFLVKTQPVTVILAAFAVAVLFVFRTESLSAMLPRIPGDTVSDGVRSLSEGCARYVLCPMLFFSLPLALFNNAQTGVRHLFPAYPFVFVLASLPVTLLKYPWRTEVAAGRRFFVPMLVALLVSRLYVGITVHPREMSYVNDLGWSLADDLFPLVGPDVDWGQDDFILESVLRRLPAGDPIYVNPRPLGAPRLGWICVSANQLLRKGPDSRKFFRWLEPFEPVRRIGGAWLLYHISEADLVDAARRIGGYLTSSGSTGGGTDSSLKLEGGRKDGVPGDSGKGREVEGYASVEDDGAGWAGCFPETGVRGGPEEDGAAAVNAWESLIKLYYYDGKLARALDVVSGLERLWAGALVWEARIRILQGRYESALECLVRYERETGARLSGNAAIWSEMACLLSGKGRRGRSLSPYARTVRAMGLLLLVDPDGAEPFLDRVLSEPGFTVPDKPAGLEEEARFGWGIYFVHKRDFERAFLMLRSLPRGRPDEKVVEFHLKRAACFVSMSRSRDRAVRRRLVTFLMHLGDAPRAVRLLRTLLAEDPFDYDCIRRLYMLVGNQKLGFFIHDLGRNSLYDGLEPGSGRYRRADGLSAVRR